MNKLRKKIIMCTRMPHNNSYIGGVVTIVKQYLDNNRLFNELGYEVELFNYENDRIERILNPKLKNIIYAIFQKRALVKRIRKESDGIVHVHTSRKWLLLKDLFLCKYLKRHSSWRTFVTIHFADTKEILYSNSIIRKLEIRYINRYVDGLLLLSAKTEDEFINLGVNPNKTSVEYTFHNFECDINTEVSKPVNLLFVGSIDKRKGILDLLEALSRMPRDDQYRLHVCGQITDKSIQDEYVDKCKKIEGNVVFHGYVSGEEKLNIFKSADVLILPSYGEGMPIVIMEAIASGTAVVSTTVGAIPEVIKNENGCLIKPGDVKKLAEVIQILLNNTEMVRSMKCANYFKGSQYSLKSHIERLCFVYDNILYNQDKNEEDNFII